MSLTSQPEAGDQLAGFAERPVDDSATGAIERNTLACEEGLRPSPARMMPALISSSLYLQIASNISFVGRMPFSLSSVVFASTITRIVCLPVSAEVKRRFA